MTPFGFRASVALMNRLGNPVKLPLLSALHLLPAFVVLYAGWGSLGTPTLVIAFALMGLALYAMLSFFLQANLGWVLLLAVVRRIGEGDLTARIDTSLGGHFGHVMRELEKVNRNLGEIVVQARGSAESVSNSSEEISASSSHLSQRTEQQATTLEETASSMEEVAAGVRENAGSCQRANGLARQAEAAAKEGAQAVQGVLASMDTLERGSKRMADIIGTIDQIAFQTNILALNAAVEAAHAGDQGHGFAVVATEVRALAKRSAEAAKQISSLISESVAQAADGGRNAQKAGNAMEMIVVSAEQTSGLIAEISTASAEQASAVEEINRAISQLEGVTQQNAALVEQASAVALSSAEEARRLAKVVTRFRTDSTAAVLRR